METGLDFPFRSIPSFFFFGVARLAVQRSFPPPSFVSLCAFFPVFFTTSSKKSRQSRRLAKYENDGAVGAEKSGDLSWARNGGRVGNGTVIYYSALFPGSWDSPSLLCFLSCLSPRITSAPENGLQTSAARHPSNFRLQLKFP